MKALRALACGAVWLAGLAKLSGAALEEGLLAHLPLATDLRFYRIKVRGALPVNY